MTVEATADRIWAGPTTQMYPNGWGTGSYALAGWPVSVEYVRGDLHAAAIARAEAAEARVAELEARMLALRVPGHGSTSPEWERGFRDGFEVAKRQAVALAKGSVPFPSPKPAASEATK